MKPAKVKKSQDFLADKQASGARSSQEKPGHAQASAGQNRGRLTEKIARRARPSNDKRKGKARTKTKTGTQAGVSALLTRT